MLHEDHPNSLIFTVELVKVTKKYAYITLPKLSHFHETGTTKLKRSEYPYLNQQAIGNIYEMQIKLENGRVPALQLEILAMEEMPFDNGRHMKDVAPEEIYARLLEVSNTEYMTEEQKNWHKETTRKKRDPANWTSEFGKNLRVRMRERKLR